jgi:hypothetical protein
MMQQVTKSVVSLLQSVNATYRVVHRTFAAARRNALIFIKLWHNY